MGNKDQYGLAGLIAGVPRQDFGLGVLWMRETDVLAALSAAPLMGVKVKPLEWRQVHDNLWISNDTVKGIYYIRRVANYGLATEYRAYLNDADGRESFAKCDDLDGAKSAAQADYQDCILAALEAAPVPDLVEAAGKIADLIELAAERERRDHDESGPMDDFSESEVLTAARNALPALITLCQAQAAQIAGVEAERDAWRDQCRDPLLGSFAKALQDHRESIPAAIWNHIDALQKQIDYSANGKLGPVYSGPMVDAAFARAEAAEAEAHACGAERERWKERADAAEAKVAELEAQIAGLTKVFEREKADHRAHRAKAGGTNRAAIAKAATLRAENERLRGERDRQYDENVHRIAEQAKAEAERDALRAKVERLRGALEKINVGEGWAAQIARAALEGKA